MRRLALFGLLATTPAIACAPVPPSGAEVHIEREEAIIIWDAAAKTQHFIRRAVFDTNAKDFGFLVPTPAQPQLEESDDNAFAALAEITRPEVVRVAAVKSAPMAAAPAPAPVVVLERKKVAGLDAAVLETTDAEALGAWLKKNGYISSPELVEWTKPYIAAKWKITAFKIDAGGERRASPGAVRMSFAAEAPFFPYREPVNTAPKRGERLLRVYLLASERFESAIGEKGAWPGKAVWSDRIASSDLQRLLKLVKLPETAASQSLWLTEFEDRSSPRPGTADLVFSRGADQATLKRAPVYEPAPAGGWIPELVLGAILVVVLGALLWAGYKFLRMIFRNGR